MNLTIADVHQNLDKISLEVKQQQATEKTPAKTEFKFMFDTGLKTRATKVSLGFSMGDVPCLMQYYPKDPARNPPVLYESYRLIVQCKDNETGGMFLDIVNRCEELAREYDLSDPEKLEAASEETKTLAKIFSTDEKIGAGKSGKIITRQLRLISSVLYGSDGEEATAVKKSFKFNTPLTASNKPLILELEQVFNPNSPDDPPQLRRIGAWNPKKRDETTKVKDLGEWNADTFREHFANYRPEGGNSKKWYIHQCTVSIPFLYNAPMGFGLSIFFDNFAMYPITGVQVNDDTWMDQFPDAENPPPPQHDFLSGNGSGIKYVD